MLVARISTIEMSVIIVADVVVVDVVVVVATQLFRSFPIKD